MKEVDCWSIPGEAERALAPDPPLPALVPAHPPRYPEGRTMPEGVWDNKG